MHRRKRQGFTDVHQKLASNDDGKKSAAPTTFKVRTALTGHVDIRVLTSISCSVNVVVAKNRNPTMFEKKSLAKQKTCE
jgi:hypothetical protein